MISVLIVDDHGVVREGLARLVATFAGVTVAGTAVNGEQAVAFCDRSAPEIVLMDLEMPVLDGIEATRRIVAAHPATRVIALTSFSDRRRILSVLEAGAIGYLLKDASARELADGIHAAARGESPIDPKAASELIGAHLAADPADGLSAREREVLALVAEGLPNKQIAMRLAITEKTVKAHLTHIFRTIGVSDRTQAALWAHRFGNLR